MNKFRNSPASKHVALLLLFVFLHSLLVPTALLAKPGGPTQPETQGFQASSTADLVDPFTGDFAYSIPLLNIGGYPLLLGYQSGITMDQDASWVGLGWNLSPGSITRQMRGLPDDFDGDEIVKEYHVKKNWTVGATVRGDLELVGFEFAKLGAGFGVTYNSYYGIGFEQSINGNISTGGIADKNKSGGMELGLALRSTSSDGLSISGSLSLSQIKERGDKASKLGATLGVSSNSREGLKAMSFGTLNSSANKMLQPQTYMPRINWSYKNHSYSFSGKFGAQIFAAAVDITLAGYYTEQTPDQEKMAFPAYGYFHAEDGRLRQNALLDFNREGDGIFSKYTKHLPLTNFTYDLYQVSAHGLGGSFRAYRNDLGIVHDNASKNSTSSASLGGESTGGNLFGIGLDVTYSPATSATGNWKQSNEWQSAFASNYNAPVDYEPYYLRFTNEFVPDKNPAYYSQVGGLDPLRIELENTGDKFTKNPTPTYTANNSTVINLDVADGVNAQNRSIRNQSIQAVTAGEQSIHGFSKYTSKYAANHHIAEYVATQGDGSRYIFGHAAYNATQTDCSFNVLGRPADCATGYVTYQPGDDSPNNNLGRDHMYTSTTTPAYAHAYMLSGVLSADYLDVTNDGMTEDDLGWYTKFNYTPQANIYKWRMPALAYKANYDEGLKSDPMDQKGHYVYGEKELLYLETIETKTQIAIFEYSDREDARSVVGKQGGLGTGAMQKLDKIKLYSKPEYDANQNDAIPIQTIHFTYDYSLCENVPLHATNGGGKLTLKKIEITYRDSEKGRNQHYAFTYADNNHDGTTDSNPDYNAKGFDRWGSYMPNTGSCDPLDADQTAAEFPYTNQANANTYASAWQLSAIDMPTGGRLEVTYEADDYGFVQDKPAMQMVKIAGFASSSEGSPVNYLYDSGNLNHKEYVIVDLPDSVDDVTDLKEKYFGSTLTEGNILQSTLYYRILTQLGSTPNSYEYISGYAEVDQVYFVSTTRAAIKLKTIKTGDRGVANFQVNPITRTAWQFAQTYNPRLAYGFGDPPSSNANKVDVVQILKELAKSNILTNLIEYIKGANAVMATKKMAKYTIPSKSFIRLYEPTGKKKGGGSRVSEIVYHDNWDDMASYGSNFALGQRYTYTLENGKSSGVAAFEPMLGSDENPLRQPLYKEYAELTASDMKHYQEYPIGSSFYPGPTVGYSKVTIEDFSPSEPEDVRGKTGKTIQEFYTAKDFPVRARATALEALPAKSDLGGQLLGVNNRDYMFTSQGFVVETNDMHGKPKATTIYGQGQEAFISRMEYFYKEGNAAVSKMQPAGSGSYTIRTLNNEVSVIDVDGTVATKTIGVNVDIVNDFSYYQDEARTLSIQGNLGTFLIGFIPGAYMALIPWQTCIKTGYRSAVTTKVIQRAGIIDHVVAYDAGSRVETKNLAWDGETGEVLVTETQNAYDDPIYQFNYPAHWAYQGMGQAYKNIGFSGLMKTNSSGLIDVRGPANPADYLVPGDEVVFGVNKGWVIDNTNISDTILYLIDASGELFTTQGPSYFKVVRSGRRNQQAVAIGSVTSTINPLSNLSSGKINITASHNILNASAQEFSDAWKGQQFWQLQGVPEYFAQQQVAYFNAFLAYYKGLPANGNYVSLAIPGKSAPSVYINQVLYDCPDIKALILIPGTYGDEVQFDYSSACFGGGYGVNCSSMNFVDAPSLVPNWTDLQWIDPATIDIQISPWNYVMWSMEVDAYFSGHPNNPERISIEYGDCVWKYDNIEYYGRLEYKCLPPEDSIINPYVNGIRGIWRPKKVHTYLTERTQTLSSQNLNLRNDGVFATYSSYWNVPSSGSTWTVNSTNWTWASEATKANQYGEQLEAKDALGRYTSALYGYYHKLSTAVAGNARYTEIAFDGFEDYDYYALDSCPVHHFDFYEYEDYVSFEEAHTGKYSLEVPASTTFTVTRTHNNPSPTATFNDVPYKIKTDDKNGVFGPFKNQAQTYLLSYWVKEIHESNVFNYEDHSLLIEINGYPVTQTEVYRSPIIDGWQQINLSFTVTSQSTPSFELSCINSGGYVTFIDDLRILPKYGSMKSYVYHPETLLLAAELDENNYATFYEYDREGKLIRVKKETEKGIVTLQETRTGIVGQP
jgi:hypothetical protein